MTATAEKNEVQPVKATITLPHLKHALKIAETAIPRASTNILPILHSVRIEETKDGLAVDATDLDIAVRALIPETPGLTRPLIIPSDRFPAWVKLLDGDEVKISATETRATLKNGDGKIVVPLLNPSLWPQTIFKAEAAGAKLESSQLARSLRFAMVTISKEESRYALNGALLLGAEGRITVVSTDGHRLTKYTFPGNASLSLMIPARLIKALLTVLAGDGDVDIAFSDNEILASVAGETPVFLSSRRLTGSFPQWEKVIPSSAHSSVTVKVSEFLSAMERCALLSDRQGRTAKLTFTADAVLIDCVDSEAGEAHEAVACSGGPKDNITVGLCADYVIDLLKNISGEVHVLLGRENTSPLLFKARPADDETLDYVVMPMRI